MSVGLAILTERLWLPDPREALTNPNGLVAIGGDFNVPRLLLAYRSGIFPWTADPISWWSPDPRAVLDLEALHISRSLEAVRRRKQFEVTRDRAFRQVIEACATERRHGNWITEEFIDAYTRLHEAGHAHSVECWNAGKLVGGIYGVAIGALFAGESMFFRESNASKVALVSLAGHLRERGFKLFDIQMVTPTTAAFGAKEIRRAEYLKRLRSAVEMECRF